MMAETRQAHRFMPLDGLPPGAAFGDGLSIGEVVEPRLVFERPVTGNDWSTGLLAIGLHASLRRAA